MVRICSDMDRMRDGFLVIVTSPCTTCNCHGTRMLNAVLMIVSFSRGLTETGWVGTQMLGLGG